MMKRKICLNCRKPINPPEGYEYCNCSQRKPTRALFNLNSGDKIRVGGI